MTQQNEKIECMHCGEHLATNHSSGDGFDYKAKTVTKPTKNAIISRTEIAGTVDIEKWGDGETYVGYRLQMQLECLKCGKHTTTILRNSR